MRLVMQKRENQTLRSDSLIRHQSAHRHFRQLRLARSRKERWNEDVEFSLKHRAPTAICSASLHAGWTDLLTFYSQFYTAVHSTNGIYFSINNQSHCPYFSEIRALIVIDLFNSCIIFVPSNSCVVIYKTSVVLVPKHGLAHWWRTLLFSTRVLSFLKLSTFHKSWNDKTILRKTQSTKRLTASPFYLWKVLIKRHEKPSPGGQAKRLQL